MQNNFEDKVGKQVQDFKISPSPMVWQQIEAALPPEKKKRRFAIWMLLPAAIVTGLVAAYFVPNKTEKTIATNGIVKTTQNSIIDTSAAANSNTIGELKKVKGNDVVNNITTKSNNTTIQAEKPVVAINSLAQLEKDNEKKAKTFAYKNVKNNEKEEGKEKIAYSNKNKKIEETNIANEVTTANNAEANTNEKVYSSGTQLKEEKIEEKNIEQLKNTTSTNGEMVVRDTAINNNVIAEAAANTTANNAATITNEKALKTIKIPANKKASWWLYGAAGVSNTKESFFSNGNTTSRLNVAAQSIYTGNTNSYAAPSLPTSGFSYTVGLERLAPINKHWQWYVAMQYAYMSNIQKTGLKKDTLLAVADGGFTTTTSVQKRAEVLGFNFAGNAVTNKNTVHQLGLAAGFQYTINASAPRPLSIRGGLLLNTQFATKQLLYNAYSNAYFKAPELTNKITLGAQLAVNWQLNKRLSVGLYGQYNFTKINNIELGTYLRWQIVGAKVAIPLRKLK
jgi:hypothetical protein